MIDIRDQQIAILKKDMEDGFVNLFKQVAETLQKFAANIAEDMTILENRIEKLEKQLAETKSKSTEIRESGAEL
jgi:K+/H+ antiporter YhaU regulatory subunit KhtT